MTISERARHDLHTKVKAWLGPEATETLMSLLSPVGWADVATRHDLVAVRSDLAALEERLETKLVALEERLVLRLQTVQSDLEAKLYQQLRDQMRVMVFSIIGAQAAFASVVVAALVIVAG